MEAAIYLRVSTEEQEHNASLTTQANDCRRYCQSQGMEVVAEYQDTQSGSNVDRKNYQRMLADAKAGHFQFIVVWKYDRFGRDDHESGTQIRQLLAAGVEVHSAVEGDDEDKRDMLLFFAKVEQKTIARRVKGGRRTRSEQGLRSGRSCFGYINTPAPGKGVTLAPHPEDGPIVTECFRRYATGRYTLADLRDYIMANSASARERVRCGKEKCRCSEPNSPGHYYTRAAVHHILKNPTYLGQIRHGFWAKSKVLPVTPAKKQAAIFQIEGQHPGLVDQETFDQVQEILKGNKAAMVGRRRDDENHHYLFMGLVRCTCGHRYTGHKNGRNSFSYYCTRKNDQGTCANKSVSETKLWEAIIRNPDPNKSDLEKVLIEHMLPETRMALMQKDSELVQRQRKAESAGKDGVVEELARLETELEGYSRMRARDEFTAEEYQEYRNKILPQIASLKELVSAAPVKVQTLEPLVKALDLLDVDSEGHLVKGGQPLDTQDWRWLLSMTLEGITIVEGQIKATWKEFVSME